jgi:hypothetical protein
MIIIRTRHRIESTSLLDINHRYIKGILSAPKVSWEVNLYFGLRAFHREWSLGVESKQSSMIGGLYQFFSSCQCSWSLCFVPNFWILSCVVQWKRCSSFSLLSPSSSPLSCSHRVLLPLFRGFSPVYITEHIQKYCSIENFIKLPFQRLFIHLNRSPNEGAMAVLFPLLHAVQKISERATFGNSAIPSCRNLRLTWFLICWKRNFMGLLNIQRYLVDLPWGCA